MKPFLSPAEILEKEKDNFWLWVPVLFGFGAAFYIGFAAEFLSNFFLILALFFAATFFAYLNRHSFRFLIYTACAIFLAGSFYAALYEKTFLHHTPITGKIYVDGIGKVESIKKFYNPINHLEGATLVISNPDLYQANFSAKKPEIKKPKVKKNKIKKEKIPTEPKKRKSKKQKAQEIGLTIEEYEEKVALEKIKKAEEKLRKKAEKKAEFIQKNYINVANYQDRDRKFLDFSKNYQQVKWVDFKGRNRFPHPPQKILVNLVKYQGNISVNDVIALRMLLQPPDKKEFSDDFDLDLNSKAKKIGAYGFAFGEVRILKKSEITSIDQYFINLREKIKNKIFATLEGDSAAIAIALLIGDQKYISKDLMNNIRSSGLAHLLSISGFHLSLMATIFLVSSRFLLSRNEYLALNFDLKKTSAILAIFSTYFYLKISDLPLPAQRSFLMVVFVLVAIFLSEKINAKRTVMSAAFLMILANPYSVFNIGFQLSFAAIIVLGAFYDEFSKRVKLDENQNFLQKSFWYFLVIILTSIAIQIATIPLLMHSFRNVSVLGFLANISAIPLASFFIMPLGFLALFLMPFGLEKYILLLMKYGLNLIEKISFFVANFDYSHFISPQLPNIGLIIAIVGLLIICLSRSELRILGILLFASSFLTLSFAKKPDISFNRNQRFFTIYDKQDGLIFSKNLKPSRMRQKWMDEFDEKEFKSLENFSNQEQKDRRISCNKEQCLITRDKKILVLLARNKISEICKNNFDVIVNLTAKYELPACIENNKIKIDNMNFYQKGGQFFYFKDEGLIMKTTDR